MIWKLLILLSAFILSKLYQQSCVFNDDYWEKKKGWIPYNAQAKVWFFLLLAVLVLYSGLRSVSNDTALYISSFTHLVPSGFSSIKDVIAEDAFGFWVYEILIKTIFGNNYSWFLTITALITLVSNIIYFRKYSRDFSLSVFLLITTTYYSFTMAAVRQCLAMAIAIWAIPKFCKKEWIKGMLIILIASTIHEYCVIYICAIFLCTDVFNSKTIVALLATILAAVYFTRMSLFFTEAFGYEQGNFIMGTGTNILRVIVWSLPIIMSFIYKKQINEVCNAMSTVNINMALIGGMIMFLALFGGGNLIGRMAYYMYPFFIISFSNILSCVTQRRNYNTLRGLCVIGFFSYYAVLSLRGLGFWEDELLHNSISILFLR